MLSPEKLSSYNHSVAIATQIYSKTKMLKNKQHKHFGLIRTSLIENGLALTIDSPEYAGHIYITAQNKATDQDLKILFIPHELKAHYINESLAYIELFENLFKRRTKKCS